MSDPHLNTSLVGDPQTAAHRVVFLHGLFGRGRNFGMIATGLAPEAASLLVDLPNHGASGWTDRFDYAEIADIVANELRRGFAADGSVDVVGHSMGGKVAMVLALRHPDLVRRLVVLDISPVDSRSSRGEFQHLLYSLSSVDLSQVSRRSDAEDRLREKIPKDGVRSFLLQNLKRGDRGYEWEPNLALLRAELPNIMGWPDTSGAQFTGPVLWVRGERSDYVIDEDAPAMRALFPRTRRLTLRDANHWVHSDKPAEVIDALRGFLLS